MIEEEKTNESSNKESKDMYKEIESMLQTIMLDEEESQNQKEKRYHQKKI